MGILTETLIKPFKLNNDFAFGRAIAYSHPNGNSMLISIKNGTTLVLDSSLLSQITAGNPSEELQFLLVQRGFASIPGSTEPVDQNNTSCRPAFFLIDLTNGCNLNCRYCFRKPDEEKELISEERITDIVDFLEKYIEESQLSHLTVQTWGGEPMAAFERIEFMVRLCRSRGLPIRFTMETNGTLIDEPKAAKLKEYDISVGISIDGVAEVHNSQRPFRDGRESLNRIKESLEILRQAEVRNISSISVVTAESIDSIPESVKFLTEELHLDSLKMNIMKRTAYNDSEIALSKEQIEKFAKDIVDEVYSHYREGKPFCEANVSAKIANLLYRPGGDICIAKGCSAGKELISINRKGEIYPCEMSDYPEECLGTIYDSEPLSERIRKAVAQNDFYQTKKKDECETCAWWYFCRGGCSSSVKYEHGCICGVEEDDCTLNRALYPILAELILSDPEIAEQIAAGGGYENER